MKKFYFYPKLANLLAFTFKIFLISLMSFTGVYNTFALEFRTKLLDDLAGNINSISNSPIARDNNRIYELSHRSFIEEEDVIPPTVKTRDITVILDESGNAMITAEEIDDNSSDNVGITGFFLDLTSFDCSQIGDNTVSLTARDAAGNMASAMAVVTVLDKTQPKLLEKSYTLMLNSEGMASFNPKDYSFEVTLVVNPTYTSNWVIFRYFQDDLTPEELDGLYFTLDGLSYHQLFFDYTDRFDQSYFYLDTDGHNSGLNAQDIFGKNRREFTLSFASWYDTCGDVEVSLSQNEFGCDEVGNHTLNLLLSDAQGNSIEESVVITIEDTIRPHLTTKDLTIEFENEADVPRTIASADLVDKAMDNCTIQYITISQEVFSPANAGANEVKVIVTDKQGNHVEQTAVVTVVVPDQVPPKVVTKDITVQLEQSGGVSISPEQIDNGSSDNLRITSLTLDQTYFDCSSVGDNVVTLTAQDAAGNRASELAIVTVVDNSRPTLLEKNYTLMLDSEGKTSFNQEDYTFEVTLLVDPEYPSNLVIFRNLKADFEPEKLDGLYFTLDGFTYHQLFLYKAYIGGDAYYYIDKDGSSGTPNAQDIFGEQMRTFSLKFASWYDNCGDVQVGLPKKDFTCDDLGENTLAVTFTDTYNNQLDETIVVTVKDTIKPLLSTKNLMIEFEHEEGEAVTIESQNLVVEATDNCGIQEITLSRNTFNASDAGENDVVVMLTDTYGNSVEQTAVVTVVVPDHTPPMVITQDIQVELDESGKATISPEQVDHGSSDNLRITNLSLDRTFFDCSHLGENTVVLTAFDAAGNRASETAVVTVVDNIPPSISNKPLMVMLDAEGNASFNPADYFFEMSLTVYGNYDYNRISLSRFENRDVAPEDLDGLYFRLEGAPYHQLFFDRTYSDGSSFYYIDREDYSSNPNMKELFGNQSRELNLSFTPWPDNCVNVQIALSQNEFSCNDIGDNTLTLTARDGSGNEINSEVTITVVDTISPVLITKNFKLEFENAEADLVTIGPKDLIKTASDNCAIQNIALSKNTFGPNDTGENEVIVSLTDIHGNTTRKPALVIIPDVILPEVITQNITVELDEYGKATISPEQIDNGSSDNIGIKALSLDKTSFDCSNKFGDNTVTLTAYDAAGNKASATAVVTVLDNILPTLSAKSYTLMLDAEGNASFNPKNYSFEMTLTAVADDGSNGVILKDFKEGGSAPKELDGLYFTIDGISYHQLFFVDTDNEGNSYYSIDLEEDSSSPNAQEIFGSQAGEFDLSFTPWYDNCGEVQIVSSQSEFSCEHVGENVVILTALDASENKVSKPVTITVKDTISPVLLTKDFEIDFENARAESITLDPRDLVRGATDNCGIQDTVLSQTTFSPDDTGENEVIVSLTDIHGNRTMQKAVVSIPDVIPPIIETRDITVDLDDSGEATITSQQIDRGSSDNVAITELFLDKTSFDCSDLGENTVTLTARDAAGNVSFGRAIVTVVDRLEPTIAQKEDIVIVAEADAYSAVVEFSTLSASDACGVEVVQTSGLASGSEFPAGTTEVVFTATDTSGNTSESRFMVTVETVNRAPELKGEVDTIYVDKNTTYTADLPTGLFVDADPGDALSYSLTTKDGSALPAWVVLNPEQMQVTVSPTDSEGGEHIFLLTASDQLGATADVELVVVVQIPTGVEDLDQAFDFVVYPNPSKDKVHVRLQGADISEGEVLIHSIGGQEIYRESYLFDKEIELDLSKEVDGVYFISIQAGGQVLTKKVILKK
ncbi:HYR domain-containing protein [Sunxiuqinia elliptica]